MAFPTGWGRKHPIVIQNAQVSGAADLANYPVLLTEANFLTSAFNNSDNGGGDIRFSSDEAGETQLSCEIVTWDNGATDKAEVYVKVPLVEFDADTTVWVWYDNTGETQPAANAAYGSQDVWSNSYIGVWHLENNYTDSTSSGYDLSEGVAPEYTASGKIGGGYDFENTDREYISCASCPNIVFQNMTMQSWFKPEGSNGYILSKGNSNASNYFAMAYDSGQLKFNSWPIGGQIAVSKDAANWYFTAMVRDTVAERKHLYIDASVTSSTISGEITFTDEVMSVGRIGTWDNAYGDGVMDEIRYSNVVRTAGWLGTDYNNQSAPATFAIEGDEIIIVTSSMKDIINSGIVPFPR